MRSDGRKVANITRPTVLEWWCRSNATQPHAVTAVMYAMPDRMDAVHSGRKRLCWTAEKMPARCSPATMWVGIRSTLRPLAPDVKHDLTASSCPCIARTSQRWRRSGAADRRSPSPLTLLAHQPAEGLGTASTARSRHEGLGGARDCCCVDAVVAIQIAACT